MEFIKTIKEARRQLIEKEFNFAMLTDGTRGSRTQEIPNYPVWFFSPVKGVPRYKLNVFQLRQLSESVWVQIVKNTIKKTISQTDWDIVVDEKEDVQENSEQKYKEQIQYVKEFLERPNRDPTFTFDDLTSPLVDDLFDVDAHVWYMNKMPGVGLIELIPYDGTTFLKEISPQGFIKTWWQFSYRYPISNPKEFKPENICYWQMNRRTHDPYGFSPLQAVQQVVELLDQSTRYNKDFFLKNAIPSLFWNLPNANKESLDKAETEWKARFEGKPHGIMLTNIEGANDPVPLNVSNKEMEWLDGQKWYMHLVFGIGGLSPAEAGFYQDVNRAAQEGQERVSAKNAVLPYLGLIERTLNRVVLPAILNEEDKPVNKRTPIRFKYFPKNMEQELKEHQMDIENLQNNVLSVNEVRMKRGMKPMKHEHADNPFKKQQDETRISMGDMNANDKAKSDKKENDKENKSFASGSGELNKGLSQEEADPYEAKEYADFLDKQVSVWEKRVNSKVSEINKSLSAAEIKKGFGDFMQNMFNSMTTIEFYNVVKRIVRSTMMKGHEEVEEELDKNITVTDLFKQKAEGYAQQQYEGYTLPDGDKWPGLKGVAADTQFKILAEVEEGLKNKENNEMLAARIKGVFQQLKDGRAMVIAKTESARFVNEGRLTAMKTFQAETGISMSKKWVALVDEKTCSICKSLDGQIVGVNEYFKASGRTVDAPPCGTHPNCRCFIQSMRSD